MIEHPEDDEDGDDALPAELVGRPDDEPGPDVDAQADLEAE